MSVGGIEFLMRDDSARFERCRKMPDRCKINYTTTRKRVKLDGKDHSQLIQDMYPSLLSDKYNNPFQRPGEKLVPDEAPWWCPHGGHVTHSDQSQNRWRCSLTDSHLTALWLLQTQSFGVQRIDVSVTIGMQGERDQPKRTLKDDLKVRYKPWSFRTRAV